MLIQAADQFNVLSVLVVNLCSEVFTERMGGYILIFRTEPVANLFQMLLHCPDTDREYQIIALNALRVRVFKEKVVDLFLNLETANLSGLMLNDIESVAPMRSPTFASITRIVAIRGLGCMQSPMPSYKVFMIVSYCSCVQAVVVFPAILTILLLTDFSSNRQRHC